jgi:hypothetical protein
MSMRKYPLKVVNTDIHQIEIRFFFFGGEKARHVAILMLMIINYSCPSTELGVSITSSVC